MKKVWIDNYYQTNSELVDEIAEILGRQDFNVELFGCLLETRKLPNSYTIVDFGSRDTLVICDDGNVIDDIDEIREIEEKMYAES